MSPERWQQINQLFEQALTRPLEQRADFLAQACDGNETLRDEVLSLLAAHDKDALVAQPLSAVAAELLTLTGPSTLPLPAVAVGKRLGAYRITGLIGQGGMGAVYAAVRDDDQYQQKKSPSNWSRLIWRVAVWALNLSCNAFAASGRFWRGWNIRTSRACWMVARCRKAGRTW